jgi:hypothetical protein
VNMADLPLSSDVIALNPELSEQGVLGPIRVERKGSLPALMVVNGRPLRSRLEERAWTQWVPAQQPSLALYEPLTFALTGGRYTPDFVLKFADGETWVIEVKGSWRAFQSGRSSRRNLRQAAVEFAWFGRWFSLMPGRKGKWELTEYGR